MSGDYSRHTFDPKKHYSGVLMQQGRVQLDADWNEQVEIHDRHLRAVTADIIGRCGVPRETPDGFKIEIQGDDASTLSIGRGRIYVNGLLAENHGKQPLEFDSILKEERGSLSLPYNRQPYYPEPDPIPESGGPHLIYLDVWQRELTALQDSDLIEKAVGVDTTTRLQTVWQVKVLPDVGKGITCNTPDEEIEAWQKTIQPSAGRLSTAAIGVFTERDPCLIPPSGGYRGLENRLYRVEIHDKGKTGSATFKWSRDNGTIASPITSIQNPREIVVASVGRDSVLRFNAGDWVEITDDWREFSGMPGEIRKIQSVDDATQTIILTYDLDGQFPVDGEKKTDPSRHTRIRRWDQKGQVRDADGDLIVDLDEDGSSGLIPVPADGTPVILEDGIQIIFNTAPVDGEFRVGDYWSFAARTVDASVEELRHSPPQGIFHHYCRLALMESDNGKFSLADCRHLFPPLTSRSSCCTYSVGDGKKSFGDFNSLEAAVKHLPQQGGQVCLLPGEHETNVSIAHRQNITISGCPKRTMLFPGQGRIDQPVIDIFDSSNIDISGIDFIAPGGCAIRIRGSNWEEASNIIIKNNRILAMTNGIVLERGRSISIENNIVQLLNEDKGGAVISLQAGEARIQNNTISVAFAGEGMVRGRVLDAQTNEPIPGCHVVIREHNLGSVTQKDGRFSIHHVPVGNNTVVARMVGYLTRKEEVTVQADISTKVEFSLERIIHPGSGIGADIRAEDTHFIAADIRELHHVLTHCQKYNDVKPVINDLTVHAEFLWSADIQPTSRAQYKAYGGIHIKGASERVTVCDNKIHGGAGNGITLGGFLSEKDYLVEPVHEKFFIKQNQKEHVLLYVRDKENRPLSNIDFYFIGKQKTYHEKTNKEGILGIQNVEQGKYKVITKYGWKIDKIEKIKRPIKLNLIELPVTISQYDHIMPDEAGFIYKINIENNEISNMGFSGIGFERFRKDYDKEEAEANKFSYREQDGDYGIEDLTKKIIDLMVPGSVVTTTNEIREIFITRNRIHKCIHSPSPMEDMKELPDFCYGGISLGMCRSPQIFFNHIFDNVTHGQTFACGIFIAYGENIEITNNTVERNVVFPEKEDLTTVTHIPIQEIFSCGIFVRLAAYLSLGISDNNHCPAICIQSNKIDQLMGSSINIFACGPVLCVNNYFNSESDDSYMKPNFSGGTVQIINFGGFIKNINYEFDNIIDVNQQAVESKFPSGATIFNSNITHAGRNHRSPIGQLFVITDDLGFDGCQCINNSIHQVIANTYAIGGTLRFIGNRFTERSNMAIYSIVSHAQFMNTTVNNQADHCINAVVNNLDFSSNLVTFGNTILNQKFCDELKENINIVTKEPANLKIIEELSKPNVFMKEYSIKAVNRMHDLHVLRKHAMDDEYYRLEFRFGKEDIRVSELSREIKNSVEVLNVLKIAGELAQIEPAVPGKEAAIVDGRLTFADYRGIEGVRVELVNVKGETLTSAVTTDRSGYYAFAIPENELKKLEKGEIFISVKDPAGNEVLREKDPVKLEVNKINRKEIHLADPETILSILRTAETKRPPETSTDLELIKGVGPVRAAKLREAGIKNVETLIRTDTTTLSRVLAGMDVNEVKKEAESILGKKK